ncbi:MAG: hypothetical protein ACOYOK_01175 [Pseudobdellovibrionaceae bacterium]
MKTLNKNLKSLAVLIIGLGLGLQAQARVADFNNMINENMEAQDKLHKTLKSNIKSTEQALNQKLTKEKTVVVESESPSYNSPTKKSLLTVRKEKEFHRGTPMKQKLEKIANEVNSSDKSF